MELISTTTERIIRETFIVDKDGVKYSIVRDTLVDDDEFKIIHTVCEDHKGNVIYPIDDPTLFDELEKFLCRKLSGY